MNFIDAHSHLQNSETDVEKLLAAATEHDCNFHLVNATSPADWADVLRLGSRNGIMPFIGIHPWYIQQNNSQLAQSLEQLESLVSENACGLGEIGLDKQQGMPELKLQSAVLKEQLDIAHKYRRPVTLHCFKAYNELISLLRGLKGAQHFMVHSFTGSSQIAGDLLDLGGYLSLPLQTLLRPEPVIRRLVGYLPLKRLLLESDFPQDRVISADLVKAYGITVAGEGADIEPANIHLLYETVAAIKGIDLRSLVNIIEANFKAFTKEIYG